MNIPMKVYANLSPEDRIRAALLASARNDEEELRILKETCPKKTFLMTDPAYAEAMMSIFNLLLFEEYCLSLCTMDFQMAGTGQDACSLQNIALAHIASSVVALERLFAERGLDLQVMAQNAPPRHPYVTAAVVISEGMEKEELVEARLQHMREYLDA